MERLILRTTLDLLRLLTTTHPYLLPAENTTVPPLQTGKLGAMERPR